MVCGEGTTPPHFYQPLLPIFLCELSALVSDIVELVSTWLISVAFVLTEAMVIIAFIGVCAVLIVIILIVVFVVSTIGGIQVGIPTRLVSLEFGTPIFFILRHDFVTASASLGIVVVSRN
jgi:hypothetical protein